MLYRREGSEEEIDKYHWTSKRTRIVIAQSNLLVLMTYKPMNTFETDKFNQPLTQLLFHRGKQSPLMTIADSKRLVNLIGGLKARMGKNTNERAGDDLSFGRIELSPTSIRFSSGECYNVHKNDSGWLDVLMDALNAFITNRGDFPPGKKSEYPLQTSSTYSNGVTTDSMFNLTHHGDRSYGQVSSFLRYVHSTDGKGGQLTLQYAQTQLHIGTSHTRGVDWLSFVIRLRDAVRDVGSIFEKDCHVVNVPFYKEHPVLGHYNCYVSAVKYARGITMTINTDLSHLNSKVSLTIQEDNFNQLVTFLTAITIYLEKKSSK